MPISFRNEPFTIEIREGLAYLTWKGEVRRVLPLRVLRIENERVSRCLAEYDQRRADVVPFRTG